MDETAFSTRKLAFAAEWSISPEHGDKALADVGGAGTVEDGVVMCEPAKCIRSVHIKPGTGTNGGKLLLDAQGGSLKSYFLPWYSRRILGVKLGDKADFFFTAAINGCSVLVTGDPASPTVYHGGVNGDGPVPDMAAHWRTKLGEQVKDKILGEVNRTHYVFDGSRDSGGGKATKLSLKYETYLKTEHGPSGLRLNAVGPWGCVFGFRTGGKWAFYLQRNMLVYYTRWRTSPTGDYITSVPVAVSQFYPKNELATEPTFHRLPAPFEIGERVFPLSTLYPVPKPLDAVLKAAQNEFLKYCLHTLRPEALFVLLVREYKADANKTKAIALFDTFCAANAPLRLHHVDARFLAPADADLVDLVQQFRDMKEGADAMSAIGRLVSKGKRKPAKDMFDAIVDAAMPTLDAPLAEFNVATGASAQLASPAQEQVQSFQAYAKLQPALEKAGFKAVKTLKA